MISLDMQFGGGEWLNLETWLLYQKQTKVQRLLQPGTDAREVENIRGALQFIDTVLAQKTRAAQSLNSD